MKVFSTFLANDEFLPGVLALNQSLKESGNCKYPLAVMVNENLSANSINTLKNAGIVLNRIEYINNPYFFENDPGNFKYMFSKLRVFELTMYEKIVFIDADMIVCENIECLFDKPAMSAVVAGGLLPGNKDWVELNAGLLVVEPNKNLFSKMLSAVPNLFSDDGSDQGFLHSFFPEWKKQLHLHLEHKYNIPSYYLDYYCEHLNYEFEYSNGNLKTNNIGIIHFWGTPKPWHKEESVGMQTQKNRQAISLWWDIYKRSLK